MARRHLCSISWIVSAVIFIDCAAASTASQAADEAAEARAVPATVAAEPVAARPDFATWLTGLRGDALRLGIRSATLDQALTGIEPIPRVIELDRKQPEFVLSFREYLARVVPDARVQRGRQLLRENSELLGNVSRTFGVQSRFIVALWGVETDFGRVMGGFKVIPALATLAYDGRRSAYFRAELMDALRIVDQNHVTADEMIGSWAGAMGQSQFMPSSFLRYAVDQDGDGKRDLWTNRADVFASAANYLARSGWRADETWGRLVRLPPGFDPGLADLKLQKPLAEWQTMGLRRSDGSNLVVPAKLISASVILPDGAGGPAYLVYENFRTILKWNRSNNFGIAVGTLADRIGDG